MLSLPQADLEGSTEHYFADGMYCRLLFRPAGTLIVGKQHKKAHFYVVCHGTVRITHGDGTAKEVTGPAVFSCQPGAKRAVLAVTDATCLTVHRTKHKSLARIERELVERDEHALFGPRNELLRPAIGKSP